MEKKIALVTGASDGIGLETAQALVKQGYRVIMHGRNPQKAKDAWMRVKQSANSEDVDYYVADFLSLAEVKRFAEEIKSKYGWLDVFVKLLVGLQR